MSCRASLSTMARLFDFNKAHMNGNSRRLMNASEMRGDKQGSARGERGDAGRKGGLGGLGRKRGVFLSCGRPFSSRELCCHRAEGKQRPPSLRVSLCSVFIATVSTNIFM